MVAFLSLGAEFEGFKGSGGRDYVVSVVIRLGPVRLGGRNSIPAWDKSFFFPPKPPDRSLYPTSLLFNGTDGSFPTDRVTRVRS